MKKSPDIRPLAWARRHAVRLILLSLYVLVAAPLFHSIGHEDDHVHLPGGGIVYQLTPSDIDEGNFADRLPDDHASHHAHGHSHGPHSHYHDDHPSGDERRPVPGQPSPLEHAADSLAHFSASITTPSATVVLPPPLEMAPSADCVEIETRLCQRSPSLSAASPRGPPLS